MSFSPGTSSPVGAGEDARRLARGVRVGCAAPGRARAGTLHRPAVREACATLEATGRRRRAGRTGDVSDGRGFVRQRPPPQASQPGASSHPPFQARRQAHLGKELLGADVGDHGAAVVRLMPRRSDQRRAERRRNRQQRVDRLARPTGTAGRERPRAAESANRMSPQSRRTRPGEHVPHTSVGGPGRRPNAARPPVEMSSRMTLAHLVEALDCRRVPRHAHDGNHHFVRPRHAVFAVGEEELAPAARRSRPAVLAQRQPTRLARAAQEGRHQSATRS